MTGRSCENTCAGADIRYLCMDYQFHLQKAVDLKHDLLRSNRVHCIFHFVRVGCQRPINANLQVD